MLNIGQIEKSSSLFGSSSADSGNSSSKNDSIFGNVLKSAMVSKQNAANPVNNADKPSNDIGGYRKRLAVGNETLSNKIATPLNNNKFAKQSEVKDDKDNERQMVLSELLSSILGLPVTTTDIKNLTLDFDFGDNSSEDIEQLMGKIEELLGKEGESLGIEAKKGASNITMYAGIKEALGSDIDEVIKNMLNQEGFGDLLKKVETNKIQAISTEVLNANAKTVAELSSNNSASSEMIQDGASQIPGAASEMLKTNLKTGETQNNSQISNTNTTAGITVADSEVYDEIATATSLNGRETAQTTNNFTNSATKNVAGGETILENMPNEALKSGDLNETTKNIKNDNLLNDGKNKTVKEGVSKDIADFMNVEKNSAVQSNSEITGNALNKTMMEKKTGPELKETLRNEAAAKLEILQVKTEANSGGKSDKESGLELLKPQIAAEAISENADKNMDENGFQTYLKESAASTKTDEGQNLKEAAQKFDLREPRDISRLIRTLESSAGKGESKLTVSLNPENLGRLEIRLTEVGGRLTARFFTDNETSHKLMIAHSEVIRTQLAEKGIVLENMDFGFKDASTKQDNGEGKHSQKSNDERKNIKNIDDDLEVVDVETYAEKQTRNNAVYA